jgi:hypothetical protein
MLIFCDILIARLHISNRLRKGDFYAMVMVVLLIWSGSNGNDDGGDDGGGNGSNDAWW